MCTQAIYRRRMRLPVVLALFVVTLLAQLIGSGSPGARGLVFGLAVPALCAFVVGARSGVGTFMLFGAMAGVSGPLLAIEYGLDASVESEPFRALLVLVMVPLLLGASFVGFLVSLSKQKWRDQRPD